MSIDIDNIIIITGKAEKDGNFLSIHYKFTQQSNSTSNENNFGRPSSTRKANFRFAAAALVATVAIVDLSLFLSFSLTRPCYSFV